MKKAHTLHNTSVLDNLTSKRASPPSPLTLLNTGASSVPQQAMQGGVPVTIETEGFCSAGYILTIILHFNTVLSLPLPLPSPPVCLSAGGRGSSEESPAVAALHRFVPET